MEQPKTIKMFIKKEIVVAVPLVQLENGKWQEQPEYQLEVEGLEREIRIWFEDEEGNELDMELEGEDD